MKPLIEFDDDEQTNRDNVRIHPSEEDGLILEVAGRQVKVDNLSGGGIAFVYNGNVAKSTYSAKLQFDLEGPREITCKIKVMRDAKPIYSGPFVDMDEQHSKLLSRFLLECQKRAIRRQRQEALGPGGDLEDFESKLL